MQNLRVAEAADRLRISKSTLDKLRCYGGGPRYFKVGKTVVYSVADLDSWLAERVRSSTHVAANDNVPASRRGGGG